ncbi:uncharacterized protein LOC110855037 [Folsomia candida]|uniref:uncharacterized protein LOC110855037 n=1 Tax=Folsomia candida TaxID=158441 RepID=UPI000B8F7315|nr:uncharacterized protein LOC110855037 [Folsomia candida]
MAKNIIILLVITLTIMGSQFNEAYGASTARVGQQVFFAEANIMMTFFGIFNQKAYYLDRAGATQPNARENCKNLGMKLLRLENMEEAHWLEPATENVPENGIWTDGINNIVAASFDWRTDKSRVSESLRIVQGVHHGLVMYKGRSGALRERGMGATVGYVCYMHMAKTGQPTVMDYQIGFEEFDTAEANNDTISANNGIEISSSSPKISFIGRYGKKSYFLENTAKVTQT